jgi:hypothetical protein
MLMEAATGALLVVGCGDVTAPAEWQEPVVQAAVSASGTIEVTNGLDGGPGSFRDAIEQANMDGSIRRIRIDRDVGTVHLSSTVTYTGAQRHRRRVRVDQSGHDECERQRLHDHRRRDQSPGWKRRSPFQQPGRFVQ